MESQPEANSMRGKHGKTICHSSGVETCCDILNLEIRFLRFQLRFMLTLLTGLDAVGKFLFYLVFDKRVSQNVPVNISLSSVYIQLLVYVYVRFAM